MNTKVILGVVIASVVIGGGYYYYTHTDQYISKYGKTVMVDGPLGGKVAVQKVGQKIVLERKTEGQITTAANGWSQYTSGEWGLTFQYPSNWKLTELEYNKEATGGDELASVRVTGDGYSLDFNNIGKDYPTGDTTIVKEYTVGGKKVRAFEDKFGDKFWQGMSACDGALEISRPTESKEITDKIMASVKCS